MPDFVTAIDTASKISGIVDVFEKLVSKLIAQPDVAALKLAQALDEISKTLQVVDAAAVSYLALGIDDGALQKGSKVLLEITGGGLKTSIERGRGHCHVIYEIYKKYLDRWFTRVFKGNELDEMRLAFARLGLADEDLFWELASTAETLEQEASAVLDLVNHGDQDGARKRVLSLLTPLQPLRKSLSSTMQRLYALRTSLANV